MSSSSDDARDVAETLRDHAARLLGYARQTAKDGGDPSALAARTASLCESILAASREADERCARDRVYAVDAALERIWSQAELLPFSQREIFFAGALSSAREACELIKLPRCRVAYVALMLAIFALLESAFAFWFVVMRATQ